MLDPTHAAEVFRQMEIYCGSKSVFVDWINERSIHPQERTRRLNGAAEMLSLAVLVAGENEIRGHWHRAGALVATLNEIRNEADENRQVLIQAALNFVDSVTLTSNP
jgi:hypothetical protein